MTEKINLGRHYTDMSADSPVAILNEIWAAIKKANVTENAPDRGEKGGHHDTVGR